MTRVTGIGVEERQGRRRVTHVDTDRGRITCDVVVNAGGMFAHEIGRMVGVNVPVVPMAHQYALTRPSPAHPQGPADHARSRPPRVLPRGGRRPGRRWLRARPRPVVRRRRHPAHLQQHAPAARLGSLPAPQRGGHDAGALPGRRRGARSSSTARRRSRPTASSSWARARWPGFFVAAGFCAHGIAGAGGNGQVMAEWIVGGEPPVDLWKMDIRRFGDQYRSRGYALARTYEVYSTYYDIVYPNHERQAGRPLRLPPAYTRHVGLGAELGEKSGWERVNWYWSNADRGPRAPAAPRLGRTALVDGHRHRAPRLPRDGRRCSTSRASPRSRSPAPVRRRSCKACARTTSTSGSGSITYTSMLNSRGGIECDFTVTRLEDERFLIVTGTAFGRHDLSWIRSHLPAARPRRAGRRPRRHVGDGLLRPVGTDGPATSSSTSARDDLGFRYMQRPAAHRRRRALPRRCGSPTSASSAGSCTRRASTGCACGTR